MSETDWQPIETAPRDGNMVLVFCDEGVSLAEWDLIWWPVADALPMNNPTHWMPLPNSPSPRGRNHE